MNRLSRARKEQSGLSTFHLQRLEIWKGLELLGRERGLGGGGVVDSEINGFNSLKKTNILLQGLGLTFLRLVR